MKLSIFAFAVLMVLGALLPIPDVSAAAQAEKAAPPRRAELVGVWIGFWEDEELTRLDLRADSTGYCAYVAPPDILTHPYGVHVYRVNRWSLDGWKFNFLLLSILVTRIFTSKDMRGVSCSSLRLEERAESGVAFAGDSFAGVGLLPVRMSS